MTKDYDQFVERMGSFEDEIELGAQNTSKAENGSSEKKTKAATRPKSNYAKHTAVRNSKWRW